MLISVAFRMTKTGEIDANSSYTIDLDRFMNVTKDALPWDKIKPLLDNGISWEGFENFGSSVLIEVINERN